MATDKIEYSRMLIKRTDQTGETPTIPPVTAVTLNQLIPTDLLVGEYFLNTTDDLLWIRTDNGILPISLSGSSGTTEIQDLQQVLFQGNHTDGYDIVVNNGDTIVFEGLSTGTPVNYLAIDSSGNTITAPVPSGGTISGEYLALSGGTVTGATKFTSTFSLSNLTSGGSQTFLTVDSDTGQVYTATNPSFTGAYLPLSGGTVTGGTSFTRGITGSTLNLNTIGSGTSITNLGIDNRGNVVTGTSVDTTAEYLMVGKLSQQTFVLGDNIISGFTTPTINTLGLSTWNGTTGLFTAGKSATYRIWGSFIVNAAVDTSGDYYSLSIQRNGVSIADQIQTIYSNAPAFKPNLVLPALVSCNVGDVIRFRWYQTMNANRTNTASPVQNYIVIEELPTKIVK